MGSAVTVTDLVVDRGKRHALCGLSLAVPRGQITGLLGPSGSGKTTLMRAVVGVQVMRSGEVTVLGEPAGSPALRSRVGYVTQAPSVYEDLTVRENARYFAALNGLGARAADDAIADVGLQDVAGRLVRDLSGGQKGRASLACALIAAPDLLVLDEPTVGLDPVLRVELWDRFQALARAGTTLIVSSHVMDEARQCDRLLLLRDGDLLADSTPAQLRVDGRSEDLEVAFLNLVRDGEEGGVGRQRREHRSEAAADREGPPGRTAPAARPDRTPAAHLSPRLMTATATRVLRQLRHDHRTIAMMLVLPSALLGLLYLLWKDLPTPPGRPSVFDAVGLTMLGIFPFVVMFLVTSIAMLRERTSGTLERLLTTPLARLDLLLGYGLAFGLMAGLQALVTVTVATAGYDLDVAGALWLVVVIAVVDAVLGVALGLLASAFARSEFQAVQFMPVIVLPQFFLCGLLVPREQMAGWLQAISDVLPLSYAVEALQEVGRSAAGTGTMWRDIGIVAGTALLALALAAATLRRRTS
jgi:ribosome-dependent ATPase